MAIPVGIGLGIVKQNKKETVPMLSYAQALRPPRRSARVAVTVVAAAIAISGFAASAQADDDFAGTYTTNCPQDSWSSVTDAVGYLDEFAPTIGGRATACSWVDWDTSGSDASSQTCDWYLFVPSAYANADVIPGVYTYTGHKYYGPTIDETRYSDQWVYIGTWSGVTKVNVGNNTGPLGTYIGFADVGLEALNCH